MLLPTKKKPFNTSLKISCKDDQIFSISIQPTGERMNQNAKSDWHERIVTSLNSVYITICLRLCVWSGSSLHRNQSGFQNKCIGAGSRTVPRRRSSSYIVKITESKKVIRFGIRTVVYLLCFQLRYRFAAISFITDTETELHQHSRLCPGPRIVSLYFFTCSIFH